MSFTSAALILAWLGIIVLAFGFAALLQQVRALHTAIRLPAAARAGVPASATALRPVGTDRRYVLTVEPTCAVCAEVVPEFRALAAKHSAVAEFAILAAEGTYQDSPGVTALVDPSAYRDLAPSWSPGIVVLGPESVLEVAPGGDLNALESALEKSATAAKSRSTTEVAS